jgi:hypothetical protein
VPSDDDMENVWRAPHTSSFPCLTKINPQLTQPDLNSLKPFRLAESGYDKVTVGGVEYDGTDGPDGVSVEAGDTVRMDATSFFFISKTR